jgi:sugar O-acyltransferase (sialic acid O-acetyltransferase NeuD family)
VIDLVIVGTRGQARETHAILESLVDAGEPWNVLGFVDDAPDSGEVHALPVVGSIDWLAARPDVAVAIGIGSTGVRAQVVERITGYGPRLFPTLIHPDASVGRRVDVGEGTVVCAGTIITTDIQIGAHVLLNFGCTVGHDAVIGDMVTVGPGAHVSGAVHIGRGTYIGTGASIIQSVAIGERAVVGAGAAVIRDVPDDRTAVGVPARVLDPRDDG